MLPPLYSDPHLLHPPPPPKKKTNMTIAILLQFFEEERSRENLGFVGPFSNNSHRRTDRKDITWNMLGCGVAVTDWR